MQSLFGRNKEQFFSFLRWREKYSVYEMETKKRKEIEKEEKAAEEEKQAVITEELRAFAENTTAHGFGNIVATTSLALKCAWVAIMLACTVLLGFQIAPLVQRYLDRPIGTRITLKHEWAPDFPVVVVCNFNMIKQSKRFQKKAEIKYSTKLVSNASYPYVKSGKDPKEDVLKTYKKASSNELQKYGHQLNETVKECWWKNEEKCLGPANWQTYWNYEYGNCFAFNSGFDKYGDKSSVHNVTRAGAKSALTLKLYANAHEYTQDTPTQGIRLFIGQQGALYSPHNKGISLKPRYHYSIALRKTVVHRADPFENGSCVADTTMRYAADTFGQRVVTKYTQEFCYQQCVADAMMEQCGCIDYWIPRPVHVNKTDAENCGKGNETTQKCAVGIMRQWMNGDLPCLVHCNPACREISYAARVNEEEPAWLEPGLPIKLNIYYEELEYTFVEDYRRYLTEDLAGDIGGQLGLFNGFSILTTFEVLILFFHLGMVSFTWLCDRNTKK